MSGNYQPEQERNLGARGPERPEIIQQEEEIRNDLAHQSDDQTNPSDSRLWQRNETGTGARAESAAGLEPHASHRADSLRAFDESRGDERSRGAPSESDEHDQERGSR
jgi:hypothetical protein